MLKKFLKGLLTVTLIIIVGGFNVIEIGIEIMYQLVRLLKRGFTYIEDQFIALVSRIYKNKTVVKRCKDKDNDIKFLNFIYEEEEL